MYFLDKRRQFPETDWQAMSERLQRIKADRIARNGKPAYDPKEVIRDVVASHRLSWTQYWPTSWVTSSNAMCKRESR